MIKRDSDAMVNTFRAHWNTIVDMLFAIVKPGFVCVG